MPITITMPRLSDTMEEGTLVKWHVKVGDTISSGDHLADVETDKATMELTAYDDGTVAKIVVDEGETAAVGKPIVMLAEEGEDVKKAAAAQPDEDDEAKPPKKADQKESKAEKKKEEPDETEPSAPKPSGKIKASPLARKIAEDQGIDLSRIEGSGPGGRIIKRDILAASEKKTPATAPAQTKSAPPAKMQPSLQIDLDSLEERTLPVSNMRKTIAKRLVESKTQIPHFTVTVNVDMDPLLGPRGIKAQLEQRGIKLSVNDFVVRACVLALIKHPVINSTWNSDGIKQHGTINIGVAVALPEERGGGLVVPNLRETHKMSMQTINGETRRLATKAREQGLSLEEMSDGTFTVSNLGMFGVEHFEAIINPPQAAILAVGASLQKPVVRDGRIVVGQEMTLTLSADHRVIDGATAAEFMQTLKQLIESPAALLV